MKKILTWALVFVLFVLLCCTGVFAVKEVKRGDELKLKYENSLKASVSGAIDGMRALEGDLSKLLITSSRQRELLSAIAIKSAGCAEDLSSLPVVSTCAQNVLKFSNQLSSYCTTVLKKEELPDDFDERIYSFFLTVGSINTQLAQLENSIESGDISLSEVNGAEQVSNGVFGSITEEITEYPAVIFDGPFSDGQEATAPKKDREEVTPEDASIFVKHLNLNGEYKGEINGVLPCYLFEGENFQAQVTKKGGLLLMMISSRETGDRVLSLEEGEEYATEFVQKLGYGNTEVVWRENYGDIAVYNFVPTVNGTAIYPDIFKVKVALDNGDILSFEGKSYVMCNCEREIGYARISSEEAQENLKQGFEKQSERLCVISVDREEFLAWEFYGTYKDMKYAVYFDAQEGRELVSFRIISSESGESAI